MAVWLLVLVVCGTAVMLGPVWTQTAEHTTLADLLEVVSSIREYLGRVATVVMAVAPSHIVSLHQPIASFYSFRDRFVKYTLTTPEAEPAVEPSRNVFILPYGLIQTISTQPWTLKSVEYNSASAQVTFLCCCLSFFLYTAFNSFKFAFTPI